MGAMAIRVVLSLALVCMLIAVAQAQLSFNFYNSSCPNVEQIVRQAVSLKISQTFVTIPATLRLFFHDCFVQGCDASVMIASASGDAEKDSEDNLSLAGDGFDTVVKAKQAVEAQCPGKVSCADILTIAARDVVVLAGGPYFAVELGRRDGLISKASLVVGNLPGPNFNLSQLNTMFAKNNLTQTDMIALSGAHTVGFSHCNRFTNRLYNFSATSKVDPSLDPNYAKKLMDACPQNVDPRVAVDMDPISPRKMDNVYYQNLKNHKGLFTSDQVLYTDPLSQATVSDFANDRNGFNKAFAAAMVRLGRVGVKTGVVGEIRKDCTTFN
ncbi:hypothetical protein IC582_004401 [Cucumis melo]